MIDEIFISIIKNPVITLLAIIVLWRIEKFLFLQFKPTQLNAKGWVYIEYSWVFVGILGVLILVSDNKKEYNNNMAINTQKSIDYHFDYLVEIADTKYYCFEWNNEGLELSSNEIKANQESIDNMCNWVQDLMVLLDNYNPKMDELLIYSNKPKLSGDYELKEIEGISKRISRINDLVIARNDYIKENKINIWREIYSSIGILFLVLAFSLKLLVISKKIHDLEEKK